MIYLLVGISFFGMLGIAWAYRQGYASKKWPEVKGVIVQSQSKLVIIRNKKEKFPLIYYEYQIHDKTYNSNRIGMHVSLTFKNDEAEKLLHKYPKKQEVIVKYHPVFNGFSVIEVGPKQPFIHLIIFCLFLLIFTISVVNLIEPSFNPVFELVRLLINKLSTY